MSTAQPPGVISAPERSEGATRAERGVGAPTSERVGGSGGAQPVGVILALAVLILPLVAVIERKLRPVEIVQ